MADDPNSRMPWTHQVSACEQPWLCLKCCLRAPPNTAPLPAVCNRSGQCLSSPVPCFPRRVVVTVLVSSTIQSHERWCNKEKLYIPSHCFNVRKVPESTIHMTFWVSNFSVGTCLKEEGKTWFSIPYQRTTRTFKTLLYPCTSAKHVLGCFFCLLLNWENFMQFGREIRTAQHCHISPL